MKKVGGEIVVFGVSFCIYLLTTSHSLIQGDTGEFLSVAATHGVAHAPGFPLYSLINFLIFSITQSSFFVNAVSAFFASVTLVFVYKIVLKITQNILAAVFSVLTLGTYELFWFYAQTAQIHMLYVCVEAVLLYFLIVALQTKKDIYLYLASFIVGIGVSTHQVIILLFPAFFMVLFYLRRQLTIKKICLLAGISTIGLLPYLYVFIASASNPIINWGNVHDIGSFLHLFFRRDYGVVLLSKSELGAPYIYSSFLHFFTSVFQSSWYILPFFFVSLVYLYKKNKIYSIIFCCFIFSGPLYYALINMPIRSIVYQATIEQYLSYSFLFFSILSGMGLSLIFKYYKLKHVLLLSILIIVCFSIPFAFIFQKVRLDDNTLVLDTTKLQLDQIPKNGVLLTWSDSIYMPSIYMQTVEKYRTDILIIQLGLMDRDWYREHMKVMHPEIADLFRDNTFDYVEACNKFAQNGNLYLYPWFTEFDSVFSNKCKIVPYGLINKVIPTTQKIDIAKIKSFNDGIWKTYLSKVNMAQYQNRSTRTREALYYLAEQHNYIGVFYLVNKKNDWASEEFLISKNISPDEVNAMLSESVVLFSKGKTQQAIALLEEGITRSPATTDLYKNLGLMYGKIGKEDKAYSYLKIYLEFHPIDRDTNAITNFVKQYEIKRDSSTLQ